MTARTERPRAAVPTTTRTRVWSCAVLVALLLATTACGTDQPSSVTWRNITFELPEAWYLLEQTEDRLSIGNAPSMAADADARTGFAGDVVAMHLTHEPRTLPDDWRRFVEEQDATLETDDRLTLDGEVPATRLIYSYRTADVPTREMVVVIPSREIVALALPIPAPGADDAPEVFLEHIEDFLGVLESARIGPPVQE